MAILTDLPKPAPADKPGASGKRRAIVAAGIGSAALAAALLYYRAGSRPKSHIGSEPD